MTQGRSPATYRRSTPAENMEVLYARLNKQMSPAEQRELQEAITLLRALPSAARESFELDTLRAALERIASHKWHGEESVMDLARYALKNAALQGEGVGPAIQLSPSDAADRPAGAAPK